MAHPIGAEIRRADQAAIAIAQALSEVDAWLAAAALAYKKNEAWRRHGFARLEDHCRELFRRSGRWLRDLAAVGTALEQEPDFERALTGADGGAPLGRCRATLIVRVASVETLSEWIAVARRSSVVELKRRIRCARDSGTTSPSPAAMNETSSPQREGGERGDGNQRDSLNGWAQRGGERLVADGEPDTQSRCRLSLPVPRPVAAAFEEGLELFRAVEGSDASVTSFVEALAAEQTASGAAVVEGVDRSCMEHCESQALVEERLASISDLWARLPRLGEHLPVGEPQPAAEAAIDRPGPSRSAASGNGPESVRRVQAAVAMARSALARLAQLGLRGTDGPALDPVSRLEELIDLEDELERRLGELLLQMSEAGAWSRLGFGGAGHYAEQRLGRSRSWAEDRLRGARAVRRYPKLREAYEERRISLEALLRIARLLDEATNPDEVIESWVRQASVCTVKRLRDEVRELTRRRAGIGVKIDEEDAAADAPLSDAAWFGSLRRTAGTARRRIEKLAGLALARPVADMVLVLRLPDDLADLFLASIAAAACRGFSMGGEISTVARRGIATHDPHATSPELSESAAATPGACRGFSRDGSARPAWTGLLMMLVDFAVTWDHDELDPKRPARINEVLIAFGWRCAAPGCTSRRHLQVHHVVYRSRGGSDSAENLVVLCLFHHLRGEHGDLASCRGVSPLGIVWRLGARDVGRWYRNERRMKQDGR